MYNEYFRWKGHYEQMEIKYWCRLCMMLHVRDDERLLTWYDDYHRWWNGVCTAGGEPLVPHRFEFIFATLLALFFLTKAGV